ncbi:MAG: hypothetical protein AB201_01520 [Parcubacteria bacterium C7867-006]|nr:MAG: hypothetical protein AB201_01520 [Parcubacteria bacterium C7867-006]
MKTLSIPLAIVIGCVILGGFYYASEVNKQKSIEMQQWTELASKKEQEKREYTLKQKDTCLSIYETEGKKWSNVTGWRYNETEDRCYIEYKETNPKTSAQCNSTYKDEDGKVSPLVFMDYLLCLDGKFEKIF